MSKPKFFDDLKLPAIAAPLFLVSGPKLVIECCKSGIVGTFPALNQRTSKGFEEWVVQIKKELSELLVEKICPISEKIKQYRSDDKELINILKIGSEKANDTAEKTILEIKKIVGLL